MGDSLPLTAGPASRSFTRFAWYLLAATLSLSVALIGYRVDTTDLRIPFHYDEDSLLIMPMVKATLERGSHWRTDRLGAPGIQEMHDFPVIDHLHFALIWVIGQLFPNATLTFNLISGDEANANQVQTNRTAYSLIFDYKLSEYITATASYNYDKSTADSAISGREFSRNRVFLGVVATY